MSDTEEFRGREEEHREKEIIESTRGKERRIILTYRSRVMMHV